MSCTYSVTKRLLDVLVSGTLIILLAPVGGFIALLIKLDSKGSIFFKQTALGLRQREFCLLKFRSMLPNSRDALHRADIVRNVREQTPTLLDSRGRPIFKTALSDAGRITRVGRILRRSSLDELPQLWNVLVGSMSLVGPRPSLPAEAGMYDPSERRRFDVKPGMTGLYQVTARNRVSVREMIRIDLDYIRRRSFVMDLKLLVRTPGAMFKGL